MSNVRSVWLATCILSIAGCGGAPPQGTQAAPVEPIMDPGNGPLSAPEERGGSVPLQETPPEPPPPPTPPARDPPGPGN
jgi:hypothetical protein